MCLIALAWQSNANWPLIMAANRDEFFQRETCAARWWTSDPRILAGQDLEAGGTWMGVTRDGRFAALTNIREPGALPVRRSRGELVAAWLGGRRDETAMAAAEIAFNCGREYGGFHLLLGSVADSDASGCSSASGSSLVWTCNRDGGEPRHLEPGIWAWSNGGPGHEWPKTQRLTSALTASVCGPDFDGETQTRLLEALADTAPAPDERLPNTGIGLERERALSSPFIPVQRLSAGALYGTRASTIVRVARNQSLHWLERSFYPDGSQIDWPESFQIQSLGVLS
jgi:uncharacterized protein with NRDE domain